MTRLCMLLILAISYLSSTFAPHGNLTSLLGFTAEPYAPLVARYSGYNNAVYFTNWWAQQSSIGASILTNQQGSICS
jgi:hypothetical protein